MLITGLCVGLVLMLAVATTWAAPPQIVAHRGESFDAPENTLASFRLAWEHGADGIEGDFRLTSDGRVVCIHDEDTKRIAGQRLVVRESRLADLQALEIGAWKGERWRGEKVATLEEVLAVVPTGKRIFIELKTGPEIVPPLADVIGNSAIAADSIVLMGFDAETVAACKRQMPKIRCHLLVGYKQQADGGWTPTADEVIATIRRIGAHGVGSESKPECFNAEFIGRLRAAGINEFNVWTVDDPQVALFYKRLGAWSITTNHPAELRAELAGTTDEQEN